MGKKIEHDYLLLCFRGSKMRIDKELFKSGILKSSAILDMTNDENLLMDDGYTYINRNPTYMNYILDMSIGCEKSIFMKEWKSTVKIDDILNSKYRTRDTRLVVDIIDHLGLNSLKWVLFCSTLKISPQNIFKPLKPVIIDDTTDNVKKGVKKLDSDVNKAIKGNENHKKKTVEKNKPKKRAEHQLVRIPYKSGFAALLKLFVEKMPVPDINNCITMSFHDIERFTKRLNRYGFREENPFIVKDHK